MPAKAPQSALERGKAAYSAGRLREAIEAYRDAWSEEPENPELAYRSGLALVAMRDYRGAVPMLEYSLRHPLAGEATVTARYNLGVAYEASGRDRDAERIYIAIVHELDSKSEPNVIPYVNLGGIAYRAGREAEGRRWHDRALSTETSDPDQLGQRAFVRLLRGDYALGFKEYEHRWASTLVRATSWTPSGGQRWRGHTPARKPAKPLPKCRVD